jgi:hypothetical protein
VCRKHLYISCLAEKLLQAIYLNWFICGSSQHYWDPSDMPLNETSLVYIARHAWIVCSLWRHFTLSSNHLFDYPEHGDKNVLRNSSKKESIPFIFNDESTGSCTCLRLDLYLSHLKIITCATADSFCSLFPYPPTTRAHTCAYVTRMKDNVSRSFEMRYVIHDTRISSGQWPRCDVTYGTVRLTRFPRSYEKAGTKTYTCQKI